MATWFKHKCLVCNCTWEAPFSASICKENEWTPCDHFYRSVVDDGTVEVPTDPDEDDIEDLYEYDRGR